MRARSTDGAEGIAAGHPDVLETTWPILTRRVAPFFVKKDARDLETLLDELYIAGSNYKWQGLPFWVPVASVEMALLDLLGRVAGKPLGELFGPIVRRDVAVYRASGNRGNTRRRGDRVPPAAGRGDRRQGDQVPARRAGCATTTPRPGAIWR